MKVLNLYAGIGGNRKLWEDVEVTAIENNRQIAKIYQDNFPEDRIIIADAHKYLLENFNRFDFIWSSPPCPSHSKLRKGFSVSVGAKPIYPDMKLYEEIIFLESYFKGKWVVENVIAYYEPLIRPFKVGRHYFWANFIIPMINVNGGEINLTGGYHETEKEQINRLMEIYGFDVNSYNTNKRLLLRNCVHPKLGLHIFNCAFKEKQKTLT